MEFYPLVFSPELHNRVWGGRNLESVLGKQLPPDVPIGESWEIHDKNKVINGLLKEKTLAEIIREFPKEIAGIKFEGGDFPLLTKFLDAREWLSVQVHPDDLLAQALEGQPRGKTECWYILDAEPDAVIMYGLSEKMNADDFRKAIEQQTLKEKLHYSKVKKGDFVFVPAKTIHAIGPGIVLYELQQTSDTTYRLYDWDRMGLDGKPRELHLEKGLLCSNFDDIQPILTQDFLTEFYEHYSKMQLTKSTYFSLDRIYNISGSIAVEKSQETPHILSIIEGTATLKGGFDTVTITKGESCLIPAIIRDYTLVCDGDCEILCAYY